MNFEFTKFHYIVISLFFCLELVEPGGQTKRPQSNSVQSPSKIQKIDRSCIVKYNQYIDPSCIGQYNQFIAMWFKGCHNRILKCQLREEYPGGNKNEYRLESISNAPIKGVATSINTQEKFTDLMNNVFKEKVGNMKSLVNQMIEKQEENGIIGLAVLYKARPVGVSDAFNIQFDHIPPGQALPPTIAKITNQVQRDTKANKYKENAPTLAISNFDHRSELWKKCTTNKNNAWIESIKKAMEELDYKCAIYINLLCFEKEEEYNVKKEDKIFEDPKRSAFARYKEGFKGIIKLHYDYGTYFNFAYMVDSPNIGIRKYAQYCEITRKQYMRRNIRANKLKPFDKIEHDTDSTINYYKRRNFKVENPGPCPGIFLRSERNLMESEMILLIDWLEGGGKAANAKKKLNTDCINYDEANSLKNYFK